MALHLIGTGLGNERSLTLAAADVMRKADILYFERYTSRSCAPLEAYERLAGKKIIPAPRALVEDGAEGALILPAKEKDIVLLVPGDPLYATTHFWLVSRARELGVAVDVLHNASVFTALAETGLSMYKFGRTVTLPFPWGEAPLDTPYEQLRLNRSVGLHTLVLLDLAPDKERYMTLAEAIGILRDAERRQEKGAFTESAPIMAAAALGTAAQRIVSGTPREIESADLAPVPRCLVVPGTLSHHEEEALSLWRAGPRREGRGERG